MAKNPTKKVPTATATTAETPGTTSIPDAMNLADDDGVDAVADQAGDASQENASGGAEEAEDSAIEKSPAPAPVKVRDPQAQAAWEARRREAAKTAENEVAKAADELNARIQHLKDLPHQCRSLAHRMRELRKDRDDMTAKYNEQIGALGRELDKLEVAAVKGAEELRALGVDA